MFCKKCGAELPDGVSFCEKCGNPIQGTAKKSKEKKLIICGCVGVIVLSVAVSGILFAKGMIGGKDEVIQADADTVATTEMPSVTEESIGGSEAESQESQKNNDSDKEDMAYEAYIAYKAYLRGQEDKEREDEEYPNDYDEQSQFSLIYLEADDYPELMLINSGSRLGETHIYSYQNGEISTAFIEGKISWYQEKKGYMYTSFWAASGLSGVQSIYQFESESIREISSENIENIQEWSEEKGRIEMAREAGIQDGAWSDLNCKNSLDEAYTQFLSLENR